MTVAGALLQHAGAAQVPAHRSHRVGRIATKRSAASRWRIPTSAFTLQHNGRLAASPAGARPSRARRGAARRRVRRRRRQRSTPRPGALDRGLRGAAGATRRSDSGAVRVRQRPLRPRPRCWLTRCAKRIATCCITTASRPTRSGSRSIRAASTSTCIRRRPKCAFANPAPSISSSSTRSSARSPATRRDAARRVGGGELGIAARALVPPAHARSGDRRGARRPSRRAGARIARRSLPPSPRRSTRSSSASATRCATTA